MSCPVWRISEPGAGSLSCWCWYHAGNEDDIRCGAGHRFVRPSWGKRELVVAAVLDFIRNPDGQKLACLSLTALLLCAPALAFDLVARL